MSQPKEVTDNANATHLRSDVDIVTLSKEPCYYCKRSPCVCYETPFKNSTRHSQTPQGEQETADPLSPFTKTAMQSQDDNPHSQNDSTLASCPIVEKNTCVCQQSRPTSRVPDPTDDGDRLCVICWKYGCKKHPKSN